jgi:hypothetical protein
MQAMRLDRDAVASARAAAEDAKETCLAARQARQTAFVTASEVWQGRLHDLVAEELATLQARLVAGAAALDGLILALDALVTEAERLQAAQTSAGAPSGGAGAPHVVA